MKKKCTKVGCYEPADCRHGKCSQHCRKLHELQHYNSRKIPKTSAPHLGVEIEVEFRSQLDLDRALSCSTGHHDGSLSQYSAEFKVLAPTKKAGGKVVRLLEELWLRRAIISTACGIHVHIDVRGISQERLTETFRWLWTTEETWFALVPPSRRNNSYVKRLVNSRICENHHSWVNHTSYRTLEVRLHGGSVNPHKIQGWIEAMAVLQSWIYSDNPFPIWEPSHTVPAEGETIATRPSLIESNRLFRILYHDQANLGVQYVNARLACEGVMHDYAFQPREESLCEMS